MCIIYMYINIQYMYSIYILYTLYIYVQQLAPGRVWAGDHLCSFEAFALIRAARMVEALVFIQVWCMPGAFWMFFRERRDGDTQSPG